MESALFGSDRHLAFGDFYVVCLRLCLSPSDFCVAGSHISGCKLELFGVSVSLFPPPCLGFASHKTGKQDLPRR